MKHSKLKLDLFFQRATLAEKEVTTLKEQLATGNSGCDTKEGSMDKPNFENELAAKDKEVSFFISLYFK